MSIHKINKYSVNYTVDDRRYILKTKIIQEWLERNQSELLDKIDKYVKECIKSEDGES